MLDALDPEVRASEVDLNEVHALPRPERGQCRVLVRLEAGDAQAQWLPGRMRALDHRRQMLLIVRVSGVWNAEGVERAVPVDVIGHPLVPGTRFDRNRADHDGRAPRARPPLNVLQCLDDPGA